MKLKVNSFTDESSLVNSFTDELQLKTQNG